jgi:CheY-like chemotaxis protein
LHITVQDTGIGIAPERLDAIFDPFTQADASMTRRFGGTGLGTTISRQLVALMGGKIWAESAPGEGTTFHVVLPLEPARDAPSLAGERSDYPLPPLHILAADDVPQNLELLSLLLAKRGHSIDTAADGTHAVRMSAERRYDVVLMDMQMPLMDGLAATRAIRRRELAAQETQDPQGAQVDALPIVAMTASVLAAHREAASAAGMQGFASKPVDWHTLSHEIARVMKLPLMEYATPAADAPARQRVLNLKAGLRRWSEQEKVYHQALQRFAADYGAAATTLGKMLGSSSETRLEDAGAWCHKVRGVAANLGLEQLTATLAQMEKLCGSPQRGGGTLNTELTQGQRTLTAQLDAALSAINAAAAGSAAVDVAATVAATAGAPAGGAAYDAAAARQKASALLPSLQRGALDDARLTALTASLAGAPAAHTQQLAALHSALNDFDFPLAQGTLQELLASLATEKP